jgi:hypothetical protein
MPYFREVGKQDFGELAWMGERNQVAAWDFVNGLAEPLVCHARLKVARKNRSSLPTTT